MPLPEPADGSTALVTGASSGIGLEIARGLAKRGHGVTLVARRRERLEKLADGARQPSTACEPRRSPPTSGIRPAATQLAEQVAANGLDVEILINNAGFGIYEPFASAGRERELQQLGVLVDAVVDLNSRYLPPMLERGRGAILNMSSTSAFQVLPGNGTYAAAKAYVLFHSEALTEEVRDSGVTVTACCPGPVHTEFQEVGQPLLMDGMPKFVWIDAERCAEDTIAGLQKRQADRHPGTGARAGFLRAKPHGAAAAQAGIRPPDAQGRARARPQQRRLKHPAAQRVIWRLGPCVHPRKACRIRNGWAKMPDLGRNGNENATPGCHSLFQPYVVGCTRLLVGLQEVPSTKYWVANGLSGNKVG